MSGEESSSPPIGKKVMHTNASNRVIGVAKHLMLEDTVTDGAVIAHLNSAEYPGYIRALNGPSKKWPIDLTLPRKQILCSHTL